MAEATLRNHIVPIGKPDICVCMYVSIYGGVYVALCRRFDLVHHNAPQRHLRATYRQFNVAFLFA